jgi:hypothetical protein
MADAPTTVYVLGHSATLQSIRHGVVTICDCDNANQLTGLTYSLGATTLGTLPSVSAR